MKKIVLSSVVAISAMAILSGCVTTKRLQEQPGSISAIGLCKAVNSNREKSSLARAELNVRGISSGYCSALIQQDAIESAEQSRQSSILIAQGQCISSYGFGAWNGSYCTPPRRGIQCNSFNTGGGSFQTNCN